MKGLKICYGYRMLFAIIWKHASSVEFVFASTNSDQICLESSWSTLENATKFTISNSTTDSTSTLQVQYTLWYVSDNLWECISLGDATHNNQIKPI